MSNYFLGSNHNYTNSQINAMNKIKQKNVKANDDSIEGNLDSFVKDLNNYEKGKNVSNSDLFKYIEQTSGMNYFKTMLDANGDGKISQKEAEQLAKYDGNKNLTSKDINTFIKDIKNTKQATKKTCLRF